MMIIMTTTMNAAAATASFCFQKKTHGDQKIVDKIQRCKFEHSSKKENLLEIKPRRNVAVLPTKI